MTKLKEKLRELGYIYCGNHAYREYKGFELTINFSEDFNNITYTVDIELYGPMSKETKKQEDEAYELIRNDVNIIKEFIQKMKQPTTVLEDKLTELGYYKHSLQSLAYLKRYRDNLMIIVLNEDKETINTEKCRLECMHYVFNEGDVNNIKEVLNQLQKDLEELNKCTR